MRALTGLALVQTPYKPPCWRDAAHRTMGVQGFFQATHGHTQCARGALKRVLAGRTTAPLLGTANFCSYFSLPKACSSFVCVFIEIKKKTHTKNPTHNYQTNKNNLFNAKIIFCSSCKKILMRGGVHLSGRNVLHFPEKGIK